MKHENAVFFEDIYTGDIFQRKDSEDNYMKVHFFDGIANAVNIDNSPTFVVIDNKEKVFCNKDLKDKIYGYGKKVWEAIKRNKSNRLTVGNIIRMLMGILLYKNDDRY